MKKNKIIIFYVLGIILFFAALDARSHDHHSHEANVNVNSQALGLAASGHQFYWGQKKLQGSFSAATHGDSKALSFALGKRVDKVLLTGSVTQSEGDMAVVGGASWTF